MRMLHTMLRVGDLERSLAFYRDVLGMRLLRRKDYPGGRFTLKTEELHVQTRLQRFTTDKAVTIEEPRGIIRGVGLEFDNLAKTAILKAGVSGTMQPAPAPPRTTP